MRNKGFIIIFTCLMLLTSCNSEKSSGLAEQPQEVISMTNEEIKTTIGMATTDSAYHNGSQEDRIKYIKDILQKMEENGTIAGNITQEGSIIWFNYTDGTKQGIDVTKDNLWEEQ